jgi:hypothetical protein
MGISPTHWGPHVWASIHLICLGAPETLDAAQQQAYRRFFSELSNVIPCASCAEHLRGNLARVPLENALSGREDLFAWSVRLHNLVNEQLGKPIMDAEDARRRWMQAPQAVGTQQGQQSSGEFVATKRIAWMMMGMALGAALTYGALRSSLNRASCKK